MGESEQDQEKGTYEVVQEDATQDHGDQKALAIVGWILGWIGLVIALLAGDRDDPFLKFWLNQMLVFDLFALLGCIPLIGWVWAVVMFVLWVITLVRICKGETTPVPIIGGIHILD